MSRRRIIIVALFAALVLAAAVFVTTGRREQLYASHIRPDGLYRVDVYRRSSLWGAMPGQSSDAPGRARLCDKSGKLLGEVELEMVQLASDIEWSADSVSIRAIVDWPLPVPPAAQPARAIDASAR